MKFLRASENYEKLKQRNVEKYLSMLDALGIK